MHLSIIVLMISYMVLFITCFLERVKAAKIILRKWAYPADTELAYIHLNIAHTLFLMVLSLVLCIPFCIIDAYFKFKSISSPKK